MGEIMDDITAEEHIKILSHHLLAAANVLNILEKGIVDPNGDYDDEWRDKCQHLITFLRDEAKFFSPPDDECGSVVSLDAYKSRDFDNTRFWGRNRRGG